MSIEIIHQPGNSMLTPERREYAALFCNTSDTAFGPIFNPCHDIDAEGIASAFLVWAHRQGLDDLRTYDGTALANHYYKFWQVYLDEDRPDSKLNLHRYIWANDALAEWENDAGLVERCDVCSGIFLAGEIGDDCSCDECRFNEAQQKADQIVDAAKDPD